MLSTKLINKTLDYFNKYNKEAFVVNPSLPILYFGDLCEYMKSETKIISVGLNPSDVEFIDNDGKKSYFRFELWNDERKNLTNSLNKYFENNPYKKWFASFEPLLNGFDASYYKGKYKNIALHTDFCTPLATSPTWSKLSKSNQNILEKAGMDIWRNLIEELQPNVMLVSIKTELFNKMISDDGILIDTINKTKEGKLRKYPYKIFVYKYKLKENKNCKIIFGQASQTPFGSITNDSKKSIGNLFKNYLNKYED